MRKQFALLYGNYGRRKFRMTFANRSDRDSYARGFAAYGFNVRCYDFKPAYSGA